MTQTSSSTHDTTNQTLKTTPQERFGGLLAAYAPGQVISWGLLDALSLFPADAGADGAGDEPPSRFVAPLEHLKLVKVPTYGTVVLRNTATQGLVIAPMHIGFFQGSPSAAKTQVDIAVKKNGSITNQSVAGIVTSTPGSYTIDFDQLATVDANKGQPIQDQIKVTVK